MKEKPQLICKRSLYLGIAAYPLSILAFILFLLDFRNNTADEKGFFFIAAVAVYGIAAVCVISSIVLGVIGIKQKSSSAATALSGIIISLLKIILSVCFFIFPIFFIDLLVFI